MILISYDISDDRFRSRFAKYLTKFGHRIQYSVFEIDNSERLLNNIVCDIEGRYSKQFGECDSVYIFKLSATCEIKRYGYAKHENEECILV